MDNTTGKTSNTGQPTGSTPAPGATRTQGTSTPSQSAGSLRRNPHGSVSEMPITGSDIHLATATVLGEAWTPVDKTKKLGFWDKLNLWSSGIGTDKLNAIQNDPRYIESMRQANAYKMKANSRYTRGPDGNFVPVSDAVDNVRGIVDTLEEGAKSGTGDIKINEKPIREGITEGVKDSLTAADYLKNPRGAVALWAKSKGYNNVQAWADNPVMFWGTLLAGGVGIAGLVSAFIGASKGGGNVVNNYYYGNTAAPQAQSQSPAQTQVPPATTSFWRA